MLSREPAESGPVARHHFFSRVPVEGNCRGGAGALPFLLLFRVPQNEGAETNQSLLRSVADRRWSVVLFALRSSRDQGRRSRFGRAPSESADRARVVRQIPCAGPFPAYATF